MKQERIKYLFVFVLLGGIFLLGFALATAPVWVGSNVNYSTTEDTSYYHNLSANITGFNNDVIFAIDTQSNINWTNASGTNSVTTDVVSEWISILNQTNGNLSINASYDNQTGFFVIPIQATNTTDEEGSITTFEFIINATNDAPSFTNIDTEYNLTQNDNFLDYINATDEEEHYALFFSISFFNNCTLATWSTRTNCSLISLTNVSDTSAIMNFTPAENDVGTYWANVTVRDWGENYPCPHSYCDNTTYKQNKSYSSGVLVFNVFSALDINASDCQDKIFQENQSGACQINITSKGERDSLNISSNGSLRNYVASVSNTTWFYPNNSTNSSNFTLQVFVNVTPQKTEVGNWTINFTVHDITFAESLSELIYVSVNRTLNDAPDLIDIANMNTSISLETRINLTVYDDDLLIPDKLEGYNETTSFNVTILNQSNLSQELSLFGFDVEILNMPVSGTNRTEAKIQFNPDSSEAGNYTINITVNDEDNSIDSDLFNLSIISNEYPVWNQTSYSFDLVVNSSFATTTSFGPINLTGDGYVTDTGDTLTFTNDSSAMPRFNLSSGGMISFTPYKQDVGSWNFTVTATDLLGLQNTTTFRFNITNINSDPDIETPLSVNTNASVDVNSNVIAQEDNYTKIVLWVQDEDILIDSSKRDYYNETLSINVTIEGNNTNLFVFTKTDDFPTSDHPNRTEYDATFTPNKTDVGDYNITINVTDASNSSDILEFNLTINGFNDAPILSELVNQTTAVNRSFYYDINASDEEDGNDSQGNLFFTYNFTFGQDVFNTTTFNSTSGEINITFNSSQGGRYKINITVNDSSNVMDSQEFWIYVYDAPNTTYPSLGYNFSLQENVTSNLTFRGNHSVQDNLTYLFYLNNSLKYNLTYYGNDTNLTWQFTPNMTDETYGLYQNLTIVIYATTSLLDNSTDLNHTINFNVNITHTNSPVAFRGYIGDTQANYDQTIEINLSEYFSDYDHTDENYNQTINFTVTSGSTPSYISSSVSSDWILTLSSLPIAVTEILNITANDSSTNVTSNDFEVQFTTPTTTIVTSGGGGGATIPISLKIIIPDPVSAYKRDRIVLPITLYNDGGKTLSDIDLTGIIVKDNLIRDDITISFDKSHFSALNTGEKQDVVMTIDVNTEGNGTFEITINATVKSPKYNDWGKLYLTIKEGSDVLEKLLFTEEFLQENPECIELEELLDEAREFFRQGDFVNTVLKIQEAINGCKNAISQQARVKRKEKEENKLYRYLLIATIAIFFAGVGYYSYQRIRLKRSSGEYLIKQEKKIFNKKTFLVLLTAGAFGLLSVSIIGNIIGRESIMGFAVSNIPLINQNKFNLTFIFVMIFLGFLIFLNRNRIVKFFGITKSRVKKRIPKNRIKGLIKKRVYTSSGDYIGRIENVTLGKNKIDFLKIRLERKKKKQIKTKGIIMGYKHIKSVGEVVIIKTKIGEKILKKEIKND